jgi:hypothetical protein
MPGRVARLLMLRTRRHTGDARHREKLSRESGAALRQLMASQSNIRAVPRHTRQGVLARPADPSTSPGGSPSEVYHEAVGPFTCTCSTAAATSKPWFASGGYSGSVRNAFSNSIVRSAADAAEGRDRASSSSPGDRRSSAGRMNAAAFAAPAHTHRARSQSGSSAENRDQEQLRWASHV